jgi:AraC-like DNA-binding protein
MRRNPGVRYFTRAGSLSGLDVLARELRQPLGPMLRRHGLSPGQLAEPEARVPYTEWSELLEDCAQSWHCPEFGLRLGMIQNLNVLGPIGLVARLTDTVGEALRAIEANMATHTSGSTLELRLPTVTSRAGMRRPSVALAYVPRPHTAAGRQIVEMALASMGNSVAMLIGEAHPRFARVTFRHDPPQTNRMARRHFDCPIQYGAEMNALHFDAGWLELRTAVRDPAYAPIVNAYLERARKQIEVDVVESTRQFIGALLATGRCSRDAVAKCLHLHPRTLQRRLQERGVTFAELLDGVRRERAMELVERHQLPFLQAAMALGYSSQSCFNQAFRRWTSTTPTSHRLHRRRTRAGQPG